jgi:tetratricopeptide (TPR) repeat protein
LDALADDDPATDVRAVFSWSYQALTPTARRLFRLLGLHPGPDVTATAAASLAGTATHAVRAPLAELIRAHLLTEHLPGRYIGHDLLRSYAAELVKSQVPEIHRQAALHRVLDHWVHTAYAADRLLNPHREPIAPTPVQPGTAVTALTDRSQALAWLTTEHPVLLAAIELATTAGFDSHTCQLAWALTTFLHRRGYWSDMAVTQGAALRAAERLGDRQARADAHRGLARARIQLGRDDVREHLLQALELYRDVGDHCGQARAHLNLAWACERQNQHSTALNHAEQAVDLFRRLGHRVGQADACNAVGWFHAHLGSHQQALAYCQEALRLHQETGDDDGEAHTWDSLGYIRRLLGHEREAIRCYSRAVKLRQDLGDRYFEADSLNQLGDLYLSVGEDDNARTAWHDALLILDGLWHEDADHVRAKLRRLDRKSDRLVIPASANLDEP